MSTFSSLRLPACTFLLTVCLAAGPALADKLSEYANARFPVVKGYGGVVVPPAAVMHADKAQRYQIVVETTSEAPDPSKPNPSLERAARLVNLLAQDGVRPKPGDIVVIIHGKATPLVLNDTKYRARFQVTNPNLELIQRLKAAGVSVNVCSQALVGENIAVADVDGRVQVDVAGMTTLATLQLKGYALLPD